MALLLAHEVQQVGGVAGVEHAEARLEAERGGVDTDHPVRDRVKGPPDDRPACGATRSARARARSTISRAARRVNVSSRIRSAGTPSASSHATRAHSVVVLPVPAPARISRVSPPWVAAATLLGIELFEPRVAVPLIEHAFGEARACGGWSASAAARRRPTVSSLHIERVRGGSTGSSRTPAEDHLTAVGGCLCPPVQRAAPANEAGLASVVSMQARQQ